MYVAKLRRSKTLAQVKCKQLNSELRTPRLSLPVGVVPASTERWSARAQSARNRSAARTMQRPRLSLAMRDNWRHLQRLYGLELDCEDCEPRSPPRRAPSLDSLINSSEGAPSSADASAPEDSDSGADTRDPEPSRRKSDVRVPKKCPQSYSSSSSGHMETIHEETTEPKVSVKEILARFENLTEKTDTPQVLIQVHLHSI